MSNYILYDLEIVKAIPDRNPPLTNIEYCGGWGDHQNMGISIVGFCGILTIGGDIIIGDPSFVTGDYYGLEFFKKLVDESEGLIGFNSKNFDDRVMAAAGIPVTTTYDLLEEVRLSAYGSTSFQDAPKGHSYKLSALGSSNKLTKTGDGANAAIEWQNGLHKKVADYCMNDVLMTAKMLKMGIGGTLKNPNTGELLQLRSL